ncbi:MAG: threonine/serine exporter family protein [Planctomycetota bacterium]
MTTSAHTLLPPGTGIDLRPRFLLRLAESLHRAGTPAETLEGALRECGSALGLQTEILSTPTSILARFGGPDEHRTGLLRIHPGDADLERLVAVDGVREAVLRGEMSIEHAMVELDRLEQQPPRWGALATVLSFAIASGGAARFFGGDLLNMAVSAALGWLVGILAVLTGRWPAWGRAFEPGSAVVVSFLAMALASAIDGVVPDLITLSGLIVLVPGLGLTLGLNDLATRHLASGTARLFGSVIVFLTIAFGVALGRRLGEHLPASDPVVLSPLPGWVDLVCLALSPVAFAILFRARPKDFLLIALVCGLGQLGARVGGAFVGAQLGAGLGALFVGLGANAGERWTRRPATVMALPGLILLVPGSIGYRSLTALLEHDIVPGIESAVTATFVAVSLATGLLMANVALPPRRFETEPSPSEAIESLGTDLSIPASPLRHQKHPARSSMEPQP